jgi:hypothetical protein
MVWNRCAGWRARGPVLVPRLGVPAPTGPSPPPTNHTERNDDRLTHTHPDHGQEEEGRRPWPSTHAHSHVPIHMSIRTTCVLLDAMCNNGDADGRLQQYLNEGSRCKESKKRRRRSHCQKSPAREPEARVKIISGCVGKEASE